MAERSALLGSVLKELAQARYMADNYSCTLSELYEDNASLRMFPVPRAEIEEAEFTLRFAVADLVRAEGRFKDRVREILNRHGRSIARGVLDNVADIDAGLPDWRESVRGIGTRDHEDLQSAIVAGLLEGMMPAVSEGFARGRKAGKLAGGIDRTELARTVGGRIRRWLAGLAFVREALVAVAAKHSADPYQPFTDAIQTALDARLDGVLDDLGNVELEDLYSLDIDATSDGLRDLPADKLTSLTIKLAVRNYIWATVEGDNGDRYRTLGPE